MYVFHGPEQQACDEAGQRAAQRAIPMLEKVGIQVKVLRMRDAKDPDEFLKKFGADRFKLLLEESSNRVEYQLNAIFKKYDLRDDDQKVKYLQESAELICTLSSSVQREVYSGRVADTAKISMDSMKLEVNRAFKRRIAREKKKALNDAKDEISSLAMEIAGKVVGATLDPAQQQQLVDSLTQKVLALPAETMLLPGHGEVTNVAFECEHNPYLF